MNLRANTFKKKKTTTKTDIQIWNYELKKKSTKKAQNRPERNNTVH